MEQQEPVFVARVCAELPPWLQAVDEQDHVSSAAVPLSVVSAARGCAIKIDKQCCVDRVVIVAHDVDEDAWRSSRAVGVSLHCPVVMQPGQWLVLDSADLMRRVLSYSAPQISLVVLASGIWRWTDILVVENGTTQWLSGTDIIATVAQPRHEALRAVCALLDTLTEEEDVHKTQCVRTRTWSQRGLCHQLIGVPPLPSWWGNHRTDGSPSTETHGST